MTLESANPFTALASLPANVAVLYELIRYVFIVTLGAYTWDWLVSVAQEFEMVKKDGFTVTIAVYFASRITTQAFATIGVIFLIAPIPDCHAVLLVLSIIAVFTGATTSYLFLLRIRAIFNGRQWITGLFVLLWVAVVGTSIMVPFSLHSDHIPGTHNCIPLEMHPRAGVYGLVNILYHILIFLCISWKLVAMQHGLHGGIRNIIRGRGFSRISGMLWSSGQLYFFTTLGMDIINMAFVISPKTHPLQHFMLVTATVALENAMACRIFRQLKLDNRHEYIDTMMVQDSAIPYHSTADDGRGPTKQYPESRSTAATEATHGSLPLVFTNGRAMEVNVQTHVRRDGVLDTKPSEFA